MTYQLICIKGTAIPGAIPLQGSLDIGRDPHCDVRLADESCSRFHAQIQCTEQHIRLSDNKSSNGTYVDGQAIDSVDLVHNSEFRCGSCTFIVINNQAQSHETRIISDAGSSVALSHRVDTQVWNQGDDPKQLALIHYVCRELASTDQAQRAQVLLQAICQICHADQAAVLARGALLHGNMSERLCLRLAGGNDARLFILGKDLHGQTIADEAIGSACCIPLGDEAFILIARSIEKDPFTHNHLQIVAQLAAEAQIYFPATDDQLEQRIIGSSALMQDLRKRIKRLAHSDSTILVTGPSGTGKELVAQSLHQLSGRHLSPFIAVNCGAIADNLFEAELFGHEKGAFTGAERQRIGRIQAADGGTLFLDEIGELSLDMQVKLLRVLQEKKLTPIGSNTEHAINVRVVAATNRDLHAEVAAGRFREDLFYRLDVLRLRTPALQEHPDDIPELAQSLLERFANEQSRPCPVFDQAAMQRLQGGSWPGNVRQLENIIQRALVLADTQIHADDLELEARNPNKASAEATTHKFLSLAELEAQHIQAALLRCKGNKSEAARLLGISRPTIHKKIGDYGLD